MQKVAFAQFHSCHLVFPAGLEAGFDFAQALAAPKTKQNALLFRANQKHRAIVEVDEVSPFDALLELRSAEHCGPERLHAFAPPAIQGAEVFRTIRRYYYVFHTAPFRKRGGMYSGLEHSAMARAIWARMVSWGMGG